MVRTAAVLVAVALMSAACTAAPDAPTETSDGDVADVAPGPAHAGGVTLPPPDELPETDLETRIVDLDDVVFNTFDGRFLRLSDADPEQIERLRDAIPPIERPRYVSPEEVTVLGDDGLVLGVVAANGQPYAYPITILNFHEIVNEVLADVPVLISYCPLCRSGVVFHRELDGQVLTFGNTSALFDNDLVMYDHQTNSYWWQLAGRGIVGELSGAELAVLPSTTMPFGQWREQHPDTLVMSTDTGFERPYGQNVFAGYRERVNAGQLPFPIAGEGLDDDRLDAGEEVLGVVLEEDARAYPLRLLGDAVVNDTVGGQPLAVFTLEEGPSGRVFDRVLDGQTLTFELEGDRIVDRETGSVWTPAGRATEGELAGTQLVELASRTSFWFAFASAFPDVEVATP